MTIDYYKKQQLLGRSRLEGPAEARGVGVQIGDRPGGAGGGLVLVEWSAQGIILCTIWYGPSPAWAELTTWTQAAQYRAGAAVVQLVLGHWSASCPGLPQWEQVSGAVLAPAAAPLSEESDGTLADRLPRRRGGILNS